MITVALLSFLMRTEENEIRGEMRSSVELCALPVCASGGIRLCDMQKALQSRYSSVVN